MCWVAAMRLRDLLNCPSLLLLRLLFRTRRRRGFQEASAVLADSRSPLAVLAPIAHATETVAEARMVKSARSMLIPLQRADDCGCSVARGAAGTAEGAGQAATATLPGPDERGRDQRVARWAAEVGLGRALGAAAAQRRDEAGHRAGGGVSVAGHFVSGLERRQPLEEFWGEG